MLSLVEYNPGSTLPACGMVNLGATCYFNSFIQSMLSCSAINEHFLFNEERYTREKNLVALSYIQLIKRIKTFDEKKNISQPNSPQRQSSPKNKKSINDNKTHLLKSEQTRLKRRLTIQERRRQEIELRRRLHQERITTARKAALRRNVKNVISPINVFRSMVEVYRAKNTQSKNAQSFGIGQEDSGEALHIFLDAINDPELYKMFTCKYKVSVCCRKCRHISNPVPDKLCIIDVPNDFQEMTIISNSQHKTTHKDNKEVPCFNEHLKQYTSGVGDYRCAECKTVGSCFRFHQLCHAPSVIVIMFNKFYNKKNIRFTPVIQFPGINNDIIKYSLIAKIEHSGGMRGGHYWANCLRSSPGDKNKLDVFTLNDTTISPGTMSPTPNSYVLFYHHTETTS